MTNTTELKKFIRQGNSDSRKGRGMGMDTMDALDIIEGADTPIELDTLRKVMPKGRRHIVTKGVLNVVNKVIEDPEVRRAFRDNVIGYSDVLTDPRITFTSYIGATMYCSYKLMGYSNFDSFIKTFPDRYQRMLDGGKDLQFIRAIVSQYNRNKTVNKILEQTLIPTYVLNHDIYQKAVNVQTELMLTADSEKVRSDAANSLLIHLRQPEDTMIKLDVTVKEDDSIRELRQSTLELVQQQKLMIESGAMNAREVAEGKLIQGEVVAKSGEGNA